MRDRTELYIGTEFGYWIIVGPASRRSTSKAVWVRVFCQGCLELTERKLSVLLNGKSRGCLSCIQTEHSNAGKVKAWFYQNAIKGAEARNIKFDLSQEELEDLWARSEGKCALTGLPLIMSRTYREAEHTASLDRIDSTDYYHKGNVQFVHSKINLFKFNWTQKEFIEMCRLVTDYARRVTSEEASS